MLFSKRAKPQLATIADAPEASDAPERPYYLPTNWVGPTPNEILDSLTTKQSLQTLSAEQFDEVIAALFRRLGATRVKVLESKDADAGLDIRMHFEGQLYGIQCLFVPAKHKTSLKTVEKFADNLRTTPARIGYYISTGQLPYEAKTKLALAPIPIYLLDGSSVWTWILNSRCA